MSNQQSLTQFFTKKILRIPKYQRSYAWDIQNVRELYEDIQEAYETNSSHYLGTIVLAKTEDKDVYNIVDGQQRLTSLIMFISAIISRLSDNQDKDYYRKFYIKFKVRYKLTPHERDADFFQGLLNGDLSKKPQSKSQRCMLEAYTEIVNIVDQLIEKPLEFLHAIEDLYLLEFIEDNESDAIRIFQTVNDRGKELSRMDKIKSLLFYYSNKFLKGKYDSKINDIFGEIFELYDDIKLIGEEQGINIISSKSFTEDDLLRHHHICFSEESYDPSAQEVMDNIKMTLSNYRKGHLSNEIDQFIATYITSLLEYVKTFKKIIERTTTNQRYYKIFSILGLSAVLYPVITQLERRGLLGQMLPNKRLSVLEMIEVIDVRVFKVRYYGGKKYVAQFAYNLNYNDWTIEEIEEHLGWFNRFQINDNQFKEWLYQGDYSQQTGLLRLLFIDYCERLNKGEYSLSELQTIMQNQPTVEHILSQSPKFNPRSLGFEDEDDFDEYKNRIGNLTLLEKRINSSIKNAPLSKKIEGYSRSSFKMTQMLATLLSHKKSFTKDDLEDRGKQLVEDFASRWRT